MQINDLVIPVSNCARVAEDRNIFDAIMMLEACRKRLEHMEYRPRVVLVFGSDHRIIGSIRQMDLLRALAPRGNAEGEGAASSIALEEKSAAWRYVFADLYQVTRSIRIGDVMYRYSEAEYIDEGATLEEAIIRLVEGSYLNLVVTSKGLATGILRMSDVFSMVCRDTKRAGRR